MGGRATQVFLPGEITDEEGQRVRKTARSNSIGRRGGGEKGRCKCSRLGGIRPPHGREVKVLAAGEYPSTVFAVVGRAR